MCTVGCARILLFIFNFVFWLAGGGLLGIGIWMKVDETIVNYLHVVNVDDSDPLLDHAATLFIVVGGFVFLVGFLGCCGALRKNQACLFLYAALVLIAMLAEFAGAILALVYKSKVESNLLGEMKEQIREEYNNGTATQDAWDYLQIKLECCGAVSAKDYENGVWWNETRTDKMYVPLSCCKLEKKDIKNPKPLDAKQCQKDAKAGAQDSDALQTEGCYDSIEEWFHKHSLILMIIGFGVGGIQIFGFILACCLRSALRNERTA